MTMKRWLLYHILTVLDVLRLWPSVQHHVVIVAGICLPILLLLGLKNGHVADLREDLLRSPTGRQVVFWAGQQGELMTPASVAAFEESIPGVDIVIPEIHRLVSISASVGEEGRTRHLENVTLYSTRPGDPILGQYGVKSTDDQMTGVILMSHVADDLGVARGDNVVVTVERARDGIEESASVSMQVDEVIESSQTEGGAVGYASVTTLAAMEQYVMGFQVRQYGWSAFRASAPDLYSSYLIFCEEGGPLTEEDLRTFRERGYMVNEVEDTDIRSLHGLLKPESLEKLLVYQLTVEGDQAQQSLSLAPGQVARLTEADDVVVPWNEPTDVTISGSRYHLVGLSIPRRTWLRLYLQQLECGFDFDADTFSVQFFTETKTNEQVALTSLKNEMIGLSATCFPVTPPTDPTETTASNVAEPMLEGVSDRQTNESEQGSSQTESTVDDDQEKPPATSNRNGDAKHGQNTLTRDEQTQSDSKPAEPKQPDPKPDEPNQPDSKRDVTDANAQGDSKDNNIKKEGDEDVSERPLSPAAIDSASIAGDETPTKLPVAVVPMDLLAHLRAEVAGKVELDPQNKLFVAVPRETVFDKARLYADTIDEVPTVVERLRRDGYAIMSEATRIREIHQQDHSLQLLVLIVGAGVFIFGTITVVSVLLDSTERKRGTIGILRVMGVSRFGVFYMVFFRSAILGVLAAAVTIGLGFVTAAVLEWQPPADVDWASWKPVIHVIIQPMDILVVVLGAIICCTLGSVIPANKASRMDPFDAIVEGRFR
jgi:ABC-type lipoprotein release transport system permease subunit